MKKLKNHPLYSDFKEYIENVDEEAFFTIGAIDEVQGKGFLKVSGL